MGVCCVQVMAPVVAAGVSSVHLPEGEETVDPQANQEKGTRKVEEEKEDSQPRIMLPPVNDDSKSKQKVETKP